jgi:Spy/CpxP family protein refolding chaperone
MRISKVMILIYALIFCTTSIAEQNKISPKPQKNNPPKAELQENKISEEKTKLIKETFKQIREDRNSNREIMKKNHELMKSAMLSEKFDKEKYINAANESQKLRTELQQKRVTLIANTAEQLNEEERKIFLKLLKKHNKR